MKFEYPKTVSLFSLVLLFSVASASSIEEPVQLISGQVSGVDLDSGVQVFHGIPFAAPPVGDLRWKPPQAPVPWSGVFAADAYGPVCMQQGSTALMSEDCLYLNLWTQAESATEKRPVMVWIHGGGWTSGASVNADSFSTFVTGTYEGEAFAENGVVLVSVNYRISGFGFMAHPALSAESERGVSGNYGILDHIAALEWVRDNIAGFGGDPDNVTIFGESAGGASIYSLLATPLAKGLFHKAISESTWVTPTNMTHLTRNNGLSDSAESRGERAVSAKLTELGETSDSDVLAKMRAMSAQDILALQLQVSLIEDGWAYPKSAADIFAEGSHNHVPLLAGTNDGEGILFIRPGSAPGSVAEQRQAREAEFGEFAGNLLDHYVAKTDADVLTVEIDYNTDSWFARPTREIVQAMAKTSAESFMYVFTRNLQDPSQRSPHAMELRYVFNELPDSASDIDKNIAQLMNDYWTQFAATGNPNRTGLPPWPSYNLETQQHQLIGAEVTQGSFLLKEQLDELDRYISNRYNSAK